MAFQSKHIIFLNILLYLSIVYVHLPLSSIMVYLDIIGDHNRIIDVETDVEIIAWVSECIWTISGVSILACRYGILMWHSTREGVLCKLLYFCSLIGINKNPIWEFRTIISIGATITLNLVKWIKNLVSFIFLGISKKKSKTYFSCYHWAIKKQLRKSGRTWVAYVETLVLLAQSSN